MSDLPPPPQRYRDAALLHAALAGVIVLVAWLSGTSGARAFLIAALYFLAATAWSWFRFRQQSARARNHTGQEDGGA